MRSNMLLVLLAALVMSVLAFACGDDDGDRPPGSSTADAPASRESETDGGDSDGEAPEIRTARGDAVQALVGNFSNGGGVGGAVDSALPATGGGAGAAAGIGSGPQAAGGDQGKAAGSDSLQQEASGGVTVQGYGSAEQDADGAVLEFQFNRSGVYNGPPSPAPSPIKEADVQQLIDALIAAGLAAEDVELANNTYYDYYWAPVYVRATVDDLTQLSAIAEAGRAATSGLPGLTFQNVTVTFTVEDCTSLREAALDEAVADADERARLLAAALSVDQGPVDAASDYSWWGYGSGNCGQNNYYGYYYYGGGISYAEGQPQVVQVYESISVTYAID